jgi:hypothetical protein
VTTLPSGVTEKLRRADLHRRDFDRRVERFFDPNAYRVIREDDPDAGESRWIIEMIRQPPLIRWSALAGEILYDLRSALDQLAFALAVSYSGDPLPEDVAENSMFPLFRKKPKTMSNLNRRIQGMHPRAKAIVKELQPYERSNDRDRRIRLALGYLDGLCNHDKHRLPLALGYNLRGLAWFGGPDPFSGIEYGTFENRAVVARGELVPNPKMRVNPVITLNVAFDEPGPPGYSASDVFRWLIRTVRSDVIPRFTPYL